MNTTIIFFLILLIVFIYLIWRKKPVKPQHSNIDAQACSQWLYKHVRFYNRLSDQQQDNFTKQVIQFINSKKFTGIESEVDDSTKFAVAASAVIPVFHIGDFNYPNLKEVLIYPNSFGPKFDLVPDEHSEFIASGMVGTGMMSGIMILSKPDLMKAYDGLNHKHNVGIHEFVHLIDKTDGHIDGVASLLLKPHELESWMHWMNKEKHRIRHGKSDINPYALKNDAEFFAVTSEYFFMDTDTFKVKHSELHQILSDIFLN